MKSNSMNLLTAKVYKEWTLLSYKHKPNEHCILL